MKRFLTCICIILSLALLAGCKSNAPETSSATPTEAPDISASDSPTETAAPEQFVFTDKNMPRIDGSTATIPLGEAVISVILGKPREECSVNFTGTNNAYFRLIDGECDILFVYEPPADALEYIARENAEIDMAPIGRDALVFLVNTNNPVKSLTTAQLQDIYTGKTTNWSQVGGADTDIKAFQRNATSGSQTLMEKLVMPGKTFAEPPADYIIGGMEGLVEAVAAYNNSDYALGYNVYFYVSQMKNDERIQLLEVDGVAPTNQSIAAGDYPFVNDFYVVIRKDEPEASPARVMYDWIQSRSGQALVDHEGYVAIQQ